FDRQSGGLTVGLTAWGWPLQVLENRPMYRVSGAPRAAPARALSRWIAGLAAGLSLAACSGSFSPSDLFSGISNPQPRGPPQSASAIGAGNAKVGLILPLSAGGNAGVAAQSMRNAAELALEEFKNPDLQLLVKDDGGSAPGAQQAAQQALDEGARAPR